MLTARTMAMVAGLALVTAAQATMTVTYGGNWKYDHDDVATKGRSTDTVELNPDPHRNGGFFLRGDPSQAFQDAMTKSKAANAWKDKIDFTYDGSLSGNLTIACYDAEFKTARAWNMGGAQFIAHYNKGLGETNDFVNSLFWIQICDTTDPATGAVNAGETGPYPDVYTGPNRGSSLPFYFMPRETNLDPVAGVIGGDRAIRNGNYTINGERYDYDIAFSDWPGRTPPQNGMHTWRGELFLASYVPGKGKNNAQVKIYDGVYWGFDVSDVTPNIPAPGVLALLGMGGLVAARRRR